MGIIELQERTGYMYVNAEHRIVVSFGYCPSGDAHLWALTPEVEALALEEQWKEADERKRLEELRRSELTYTP